MIYADLHCHTAYSDGTQTIEEVIRKAKERDLGVIAITDHDTVFHFDEVKKTCDKYGIKTVRGVEMSCYDNEVFKKVHVVGLWLNDNPVHVNELCSKTLASREAYHKKLIKKLNEMGYEITYEDAKKYAPYNIVFKMHLFMALVEKYPELKDPMVYRKMFASKTSKETDARMGYIDVAKGIEAIHKDGGIAILAHPCEYGNYPEVEKYVGFGLDGIEISHMLMKEEDYILTNQLADKYHLLRSGGSDFHDPQLADTLGKFGLTEEQFLELEENRKK